MTDRPARRVRCAYCHGRLDGEEVTCSDCGTRLHAECSGLAGACPTLGCAQTWPRAADDAADADGCAACALPVDPRRSFVCESCAAGYCAACVPAAGCLRCGHSRFGIRGLELARAPGRRRRGPLVVLALGIVLAAGLALDGYRHAASAPPPPPAAARPAPPAVAPASDVAEPAAADAFTADPAQRVEALRERLTPAAPREERLEIYAALAELGDDGARVLAGELRGPHRLDALPALHALGAAAVEAVAEEFRADPFAARLEAVRLLQDVVLGPRSSEMQGRLRRLVADPSDAELRGLVEDLRASDPRVRLAATLALEEAGARAIPELLSSLDDPAACHVLEALGPLSASALEDALLDGRPGAALVLESMGRAGLPGLLSAAREGTIDIRQVALASLARMGSAGAAAIPALEEIRDEDRVLAVRQAAAHALDRLREATGEH